MKLVQIHICEKKTLTMKFSSLRELRVGKSELEHDKITTDLNPKTVARI